MHFLEEHRNQQHSVRADSPSLTTRSSAGSKLYSHLIYTYKVTSFKNRNQGEGYEKHRTAFLQKTAVQLGLEMTVGMIFMVSQHVNSQASTEIKSL